MEDQNESILNETEHTIEQALQVLWDKAREVSVLISTLREEKKRLQYQISELENDLKESHKELQEKKLLVEKLHAEQGEGSRNGGAGLDEAQREELQEKINIILSKINSYL